MRFDEAIKALNEGKCISRVAWGTNNTFVYKQIPTTIVGDNIFRIKSMPDTAKTILKSQDEERVLYFSNQYNIVIGNIVNSYNPIATDMASEDWFIVK